MLTITPDTVLHQSVYNRLIANVGISEFYLKAPSILPFSANPTAFILQTSLFGVGLAVPHRVFLNNTLITTVVPEQASTRVLIKLPQGTSRITVDNGIEHVEITIAATHYATILSGIARELYLNANIAIDNQAAQIASPFSSRIIENQLVFQDLLPSNRAPRTQAAKIAIRAMVNDMATQQGVVDFATALTYETPVIVPTKNQINVFNPAVFPIYRSQQDFAGFQFHVWLPNFCVASWLAFITLHDNLKGVSQLTKISESEVVLIFNGITERHDFDSESDDCRDQLDSFFNCFDNIRSFIESFSTLDMAFCMSAYPFDVLVEVPMGFRLLDSGNQWDSSLELDTIDEYDPTGNGFVGYSLVGRFDGGHCLDSFGDTQRQQNLTCCWMGESILGFFNNDTTADISEGTFAYTSMTVTSP